MCVLGSMLIDKGCIPFVLDKLTADDFYRGDHVAIFRVIRDLYGAEKPVDLVTVPEELRKRGKLDEIGGVKYLAELADSVPSAANAEHYAQVVADRSKLRKVITACEKTLGRAFAAKDDAQEIIDDAQADLLGAVTETTEAELIGDVAMRVALEVGRVCRDGGKPGVAFGLSELDTATGGGFPGEFVVIGARPSVGKSALAANIALSMAMRGLTCLYVSLEMEADQIGRRVLAAKVGIEQANIRSASVSTDDANRIIEAAKVMRDAELPWYPFRARRFTVEKLRLMARRMKAVQGLDVIFVDYLQLLRTEDRRLSGYERVTECSATLKELASELECLVIAPCQINREMEKENRPPRLSDLRGSGDIEQDADVVLLLHEPHPNAKIIDVMVAKARSGPRNTVVHLDWNPALCLFSDHSEGNVRPEDQTPNLWGGRRMGAAEKERPF